MKIVLAPDKFKGSISGMEFCDVVEPILKQHTNAEILRLPLADGGDGTIEVVKYYLKADSVSVEVTDPLFRPILAQYLFANDSKVAFIEMAEASGMKLLQKNEQNCMHTTTYGTGELILDAINKGAKHIILGIGGSATNDCGIGMASALGYRFYDKNENEVKPIGSQLVDIIHIDDSKVDTRLKAIKFEIACDVTNPLYGPNGAAHVYANQKGASNDDINYLDNGLKYFAKVLDDKFNLRIQEIEGTGAAGGMGAGTITFLNGKLLPGIELIKKIAHFDFKITDVDWLITGEGKLDGQTLSGKAIDGVLKSAVAQNINVAVFCGSIDLNREELAKIGVDYSASVMELAENLEDALKNTEHYLKQISKDFTKAIKS